MKRFVAALSLLACLTTAAVVRADAACPAPRCVDVVVPVPSGLMVPDPTVRVILPEGYDPAASTRYPVLYLLHGAGDTYKTWTENTDVLAVSADHPLIIVMPDGGHASGAGWYSDWVDESRDWESFHIGVLIDFIDANFATLGDGHRAIMGLSMGGFGAMSYAARHPDLFEAAASFSGLVDTRYLTPSSGLGYTLLHDQFGTPNENVWGNQLLDADVWQEHNPDDLAARLNGIELYIATGTGTPGGPAGDDPGNPGGYFIEFFIYQINVSFLRALHVAGVPYHSDFYLGGYHGWPYWERELHWALPQMMVSID